MNNYKRYKTSGKSGSNFPDALPGFEEINRYWDHKRNTFGAKILPGEFYVSARGELIATTLGSCVAACIRDPLIGIGGMNHFMLPIMDRNRHGTWTDSPVSPSARYGNVAMERLINVIIANGGNRKNLEIKLFGGGNVLEVKIKIGEMNIDFVKEYVKTEGFKIEKEDLGGIYPRKVLYYPATGRAMVKKLYKLRNETIAIREKAYNEKLEREPIAGEIELF